jgi:hypothetical protein
MTSEEDGLPMTNAYDASAGATTGSAGTSRGKAVARAPKALMGPLKELTAKHRLLISYLINGCPHSFITAMTRASPTEDDPDNRRPLNQNEPLTLEEAADALGIRRRHARHLFDQKVFQREFAKELNALRDGAKARALHRVIALLDEEGEGKAADRKVQLQAAQALLGDAVGTPPAKQAPVNVSVGVSLAPGVVIRLPAGLPQTPLERQAIEAQAIEHASGQGSDEDD